MGKRTKKTNDLLISVGKFDTKNPILRWIYRGVKIDDARPINNADYLPAGGTPLYDATLNFIGEIDQEYQTNPNALHIGLLADESGSMGHLTQSVIEGFNTFIEEIKADKRDGGEPGVMVVIMTDGHENSSVEDAAGDKTRAIIKQKEDEGWNFFYLGANQDAWATGNSFGLGVHSHSLTFDHTHGGVAQSYGLMSSMVNTRKSTSRALYEEEADKVALRNKSD